MHCMPEPVVALLNARDPGLLTTGFLMKETEQKMLNTECHEMTMFT